MVTPRRYSAPTSPPPRHGNHSSTIPPSNSPNLKLATGRLSASNGLWSKQPRLDTPALVAVAVGHCLSRPHPPPAAQTPPLPRLDKATNAQTPSCADRTTQQSNQAQMKIGSNNLQHCRQQLLTLQSTQRPIKPPH